MDNLQEILEELGELTTLEGFTALCVELKEEMSFYDQTALVALVTGVMEGFFVNALATGALTSDEEYELAEESLDRRIREFPTLLRQGRTSIDARAVVERYLKEGLPSLAAAFTAEKAAFKAWLKGEGQDADLDLLLYRARQSADRGDLGDARKLIGIAGAAVLRGNRPRPVWLRASGQITGWINGLFAIREAMSIHPDLPFPLGDPADERIMLAQPRVLDLRAYRPVPHDGWDETDTMWQSILSDTPVVRREDLEQLKEEGEKALPVLLVLAQAPEFRRTKAAFVALAELRELKTPEATFAFITVLADVPPEDPLFLEAKKGLLSLGNEAKEPIFEFLDGDVDLEKQVSLSEIVARYHGDDRAFTILTTIFQRTGWSQGKDVVARCLAALGDVRAVAVLGEALESSGRDSDQGKVVLQALTRLKRRAVRANRAE